MKRSIIRMTVKSMIFSALLLLILCAGFVHGIYAKYLITVNSTLFMDISSVLICICICVAIIVAANISANGSNRNE